MKYKYAIKGKTGKTYKFENETAAIIASKHLSDSTRSMVGVYEIMPNGRMTKIGRTEQDGVLGAVYGKRIKSNPGLSKRSIKKLGL